MVENTSFRATFDVGMRFRSVSGVCFAFRFAGDLLDAATADEVHINVADPDAPFGFQSLGGVLTPPGVDSVSSRDFCVDPSVDLSAFLAGRGVLLIQSLGGSFTVSAITITITGVPVVRHDDDDKDDDCDHGHGHHGDDCDDDDDRGHRGHDDDDRDDDRGHRGHDDDDRDDDRGHRGHDHDDRDDDRGHRGHDHDDD